LVREHSEILNTPQSQWEKDGFLPNMVSSLEQLDLLLLTVARTRKVQQDGIHFQNLRYMDPTLAAFVGESVIIRYDPRDLAVIRVFHNNELLCRAVCTELASSETSLKEITRARNIRRKELRSTISERSQILSDYIDVHRNTDPVAPPIMPEEPVLKLKRYINE
jgi:putative transposase